MKSPSRPPSKSPRWWRSRTRAARLGREEAQERARLIAPAGKALCERATELGALLTAEMGKPLREAVGEVKHCGESLEKELPEIVEALQPEIVSDETLESRVYHDPFGVCAAISPWNFPVAMPHSLVIPALVAGNTVVLKPSEETPLIAQAYVEILNATLPTDVLQIVHGRDDVGKALVAANVDLIAFTGSREAGKHILGAAGAGLKRVILELGGKDPLIVLDDADIDAAARFAVRNSFRNAGQVCVSTERIYVHEKVADAFEDAMIKLTRDQRVGNGADEATTVGPMINARQRDQVLGQIEQAIEQGAKIVAGGAHGDGNYVAPTVLTKVDHAMDIMREETFGPVACVMRVKDAETAVELANDTPFGLGAVVFGSNSERTVDVARRLTAGMVGINKSCGGATGTPWVGARQSGYGFHGGREGHRQFTQARVVSRLKS